MGLGSTVGVGVGTAIGGPAGGAIGGFIGGGIRGKGTAHEQVYSGVPKYFHYYGTGVPGTKEASAISPTFITEDGSMAFASAAEYDSYIRRKTGKSMKEIEASYRRAGEKPTGDTSFFMNVVPPDKYKGTQVVNGVTYDANYISGSGTTAKVETTASGVGAGTLPKPESTTPAESKEQSAMEKFFAMKIAGIPVWILVAGGVAAFFVLRRM